jgi:hypothetical protein
MNTYTKKIKILEVFFKEVFSLISCYLRSYLDRNKKTY